MLVDKVSFELWVKIWDSVYICHRFPIWNPWSCRLHYKFLTPDRFFNLKNDNFWILIDVPESEALCLFRNPGSGCWWLLQLMEKCRSRCWGLKLPAFHIDQPEILLGSIKNLDGAIKSIELSEYMLPVSLVLRTT